MFPNRSHLYDVGTGIGELLAEDDSKEYCEGLSHEPEISKTTANSDTHVKGILIGRCFTVFDTCETLEKQLLWLVLRQESVCGVKSGLEIDYREM